jgi:hypothetical protein
MLGSTSLALAILVLSVSVAGIVGVSLAPWTERHDLMVEAVPRRYEYQLGSDGLNRVRTPVMVLWNTIYSPSLQCRVIACTALLIGGIGLSLGWRRRRFSWLCATAIVVTFISILVVVPFELAFP